MMILVITTHRAPKDVFYERFQSKFPKVRDFFATLKRSVNLVGIWEIAFYYATLEAPKIQKY